MKDYPSILSSIGQNHQEFDAYVFDKIDGSNLRFEWGGKKSGWYKYGTRSHLFNASDPTFGGAIQIFEDTLAEPLAKLAVDQRWERLIVFAEFWGDSSFAGRHVDDEPKRLTLIDVAPYKKGILGPRDFLKFCDGMSIPNFLGTRRWTRNFVAQVRAGEIEGITFEGVVGKGGEGHHLVMRKAKTQAWVEKVLALYGEIEGTKIINS
jgi:hypothetical protein